MARRVIPDAGFAVALDPEYIARLIGWSGGVDVAGLTLTLDEVCVPLGEAMLARGERRLPECKRVEPVEKAGRLYYRLSPGPYIIRYSETVEVPLGFLALALPRSSLLRMGAVLYTAVWDPGYRGRGVGLLNVLNPEGVVLEKGVQVAQLVFITLAGRGRAYSGVYQGEGLQHS